MGKTGCAKPKLPAKRPVKKAAPKKAAPKRKAPPRTVQPATSKLEETHDDNMHSDSDGGPGDAAWTPRKEAKRIQRRKLSFLDPIQLKSRRNDKGQTPEEYILEAILQRQQSSSSKKRVYLNTEFWSKFFKSFDFRKEGFTGLDVVAAEDLEYDDEYFEVLQLANNDNPAIRSEVQWCEYVERITEISEASLIGLFHASTMSRYITQKMSWAMQRSLCKLCGRLNVPARYPKVWSAVVDVLDLVLKHLWESRTSRSEFVDRNIWVVTNDEAVFSLLPREEYEKCEAKAQKKKHWMRGLCELFFVQSWAEVYSKMRRNCWSCLPFFRHARNVYRT